MLSTKIITVLGRPSSLAQKDRDLFDDRVTVVIIVFPGENMAPAHTPGPAPATTSPVP